ncbi:MAG: LLM class flavin-dependent oxidoreductase [Alphaproteobacteria bacterium]|nr:LLM class flavin-dependent oxidoreductase [Alphaproteobacteria bacterium]MBL7099755.1 LLM class flavin-dependent oxidoreductase [Alphaproteobacteria bacterium]
MTIKLKNGIFLAPFHPVDEDPTLCLHRDLELLEHLDRLGYEEAWVGEHHSAGYEIIASPEVFIAAAAERTKRIMLGSGVISLPYHNPLMAANRVIQLDHQTRGRFMFGVGPGLLPSDAFAMGIDPSTQRDRMVEAIEVILRLFKGERVTHKSDWFTLVDATCQLRPYTWPHPEIAVASSVTPSGGKLAGKHGFGMLCVAATQEGGYDALGINWKIANEVAAENGKAMDPARLRLVGPVHIAETRQEAYDNVKFGLEKWQSYFSGISAVAGREATQGMSVEDQVKSGALVIGTPDDAIAQIRRLQAKQGEFGVFLQLAHNWANFENTKKSYELWQRHVTPVINKANEARETAFDWARDNKERFIGAAMGAAMQTIQKHHEEQAKKATKAAE